MGICHWKLRGLLMPVVVASTLRGDDAGFDIKAFNGRWFSDLRVPHNGR